MPSPCIHGFPVDQCASCATRAAAAARRSAATSAAPSVSDEKHLGYDIVYVPAVSGFHYRDADGNASPLSYRSAFLARRAVSEIVERTAARASRTADNGA